MFLEGRSVLCLRIYTEYVLQEQKYAFLKYTVNNENSFNISPGLGPTVSWEEPLSPPVSRAGLFPTLNRKKGITFKLCLPFGSSYIKKYLH